MKSGWSVVSEKKLSIALLSEAGKGEAELIEERD
jgi:hypothetical protein